MVQNILVKILLAPLSLLYGVGVSLRNFFYRKGILKGIQFNVPLISIGNLSIGGTGKTPHIEYLIRLLKDYLQVATLSRGYLRKTKGYLEIRPHFNAEQSGDEPLQYARKFPEALVTVGEDRSFAIPKIMMDHPGTQVILIDDAFQHLSVKPGLNILLTEYNRLFTNDFLLPSGRLREWRSAYRRADIIVVSKCPPVLSASEREKIISEIKPFPHQRIFFSYYEYQQPYYLLNPAQRIELPEDAEVLLICAIAGTEYLLDYLTEKVETVHLVEYEDHHYFKNHDVARLKNQFENLSSSKKLLLTTEKDAMRLELHRNFLIENRLPVFVLPVEVKFHFEESEKFDQSIRDFLLNFKA